MKLAPIAARFDARIERAMLTWHRLAWGLIPGPRCGASYPALEALGPCRLHRRHHGLCVHDAGGFPGYSGWTTRSASERLAALELRR